MYRIQPVQRPSVIEALSVAILIVAVISVSIIFLDAPPHVPLAIVLLLLVLYGLMKKIAYKTLEGGIAEGAKTGMGAVFIFFFIGILVASWMVGGTIPTLVYAGFNLVTANFYYVIVFVVTSFIGFFIGSSLTTMATVGVAFISISGAVDVSLAITAGAIVSGALFSDKMSPISDTTNMASSTLDVDLFTHIRNMTWTTVPAFLIALIIFAIISPDLGNVSFEQMKSFQGDLLDTGLIHWTNAVIPLAVLIICSIIRLPAILTLAAGSVSAIIMAFVNGATTIKGLLGVLMGGFVSDVGVEQIDELLTRGGIESMLSTIGIILLALSMGGLLFVLGIIPKLLESIEHLLKKAYQVITASALTAIAVNFLIGEQYLSILLTGETYQSQYEKVGLANKNLSRVTEDAGTVINPLVPWSVIGVFTATTLGVSTLAYLPFAFFCLLSPIITVLYGYTGWTLTYNPVNGTETEESDTEQ